MTTQTNILYPVARSDSGRAMHIGEASKGRPYECFGCSAPMVAKQGGQRRWHFAHKPPFERCSDPDKALHDTAKALIMQGFSGALAQQGAYRLGCPCEECGSPVSRNIAVPGAKVEAEKSVVAGTRSDLVVSQPGRSPVIIEVVVTHDLEPESRESYEKSGTPVLQIRPTWDTLDKLESEVISDDTLNVPPVRCASCKRATERRRREREQIQERVDSMLRQLNERRQPNQDKLPFRPWTHDQFERPMFPRIRQQVYANALILTELGFVQTKQKPWLFLFRLPGGVFFANFGSTEEVAIWEDPAAFIHWKLDRYSEDMESALVDGVLARCQRAGAHVRVSFYNRMFDQREDPVENGSIEGVDRTVLNNLVVEAARSFPKEERRLAQAREAARNAEEAEREREERMQAEAARIRREVADSGRKIEQEQWAQLNEWFRRRTGQ